MKIALVVHDFDPSLGQGRYAIEIARRLALRHTFEVFANRFAVAPQPGWHFVRVPAWRTLALTSVFTFLVSSQALLRRRHHDLIHAQGLTCWSADVITAHVCNAARLRVAQPVTLRDRLFPWLIIPCERRFYQQRRSRHLIAISRKVADEIQREYAWRRPITIIPHGTDTTHFRPPASAEEKRACRRELGAPAEGILWLFVGEAVKGLRDVIEQLPHFPNARLVAITRSELTPYRAQAARLGVVNRITFQGPQRDVAAAYRAADLFIYPSRYDTFGMVVAEAMASGLPVVVGKDIGAAELIEPGRNGVTTDPGTPGELRRVLQRLESLGEPEAELGRHARATILEHSWDACAEAIERVYEEVGSRRRI